MFAQTLTSLSKTTSPCPVCQQPPPSFRGGKARRESSLTPVTDGEWDRPAGAELLLGEMSLSCSCLPNASELWFVTALNL